MIISRYSFVLIAAYLGLAICSLVPHEPPIISHVPKVYQLSLDDSPQKRWAPIIKDYKVPLAQFMVAFEQLRIPDSFFEGVQYFAKNIYKYKDFVAQVAAISKLSGYDFSKIFFLNFMYQYSTACTGVLICNNEGKVLHGRNLDFPLWGHLANLLVHAEYYKGGKKLFTSDLIVGSVIALTGSKPGAFSINVNTRTAKQFDKDFISVLIDGGIPTCWLVQRVLAEENSFDSAIKRLKQTRIGGPVYYVVSGIKPYEGVVIEREVDSVHAAYTLSSQNWFLVQTNYDRNKPDPKVDERRIPAQNRVRQKGKSISEQQLFGGIMFQYPTINIETIMTTVMVASTGYHNTTAWYGDNPSDALSLE